QIGGDMPPDAIEHPSHGRNPSRLIPRKSNNILRRQATPSEHGCSTFKSWMEWNQQRLDVFFCRYSAASICGPIASTFAAQNLNSGIFPNGSSAGLVRIFAAAST